MKEKLLIELLADYEHDRWTRQMNTEYNKLSIEEQLKDKKEANKILEIIKN